MEARESEMTYLKNSKKNNCEPRTLYPAKLSFKNEGKIKTFPNKQDLREFIASSLMLQILKEVFQIKTSNSR